MHYHLQRPNTSLYQQQERSWADSVDSSTKFNFNLVIDKNYHTYQTLKLVYTNNTVVPMLSTQNEISARMKHIGVRFHHIQY